MMLVIAESGRIQRRGGQNTDFLQLFPQLFAGPPFVRQLEKKKTIRCVQANHIDYNSILSFLAIFKRKKI